MWDNIGRKLQALAKVACWIGIGASFILALVMWGQNSEKTPTILMGILYLVIGCLVSWIGSWSVYGLGLVVEHVENGGSASVRNRGIQTPDGGVLATAGNFWVCPKCKTRNPMSKVECKECGNVR